MHTLFCPHCIATALVIGVPMILGAFRWLRFRKHREACQCNHHEKQPSRS